MMLLNPYVPTRVENVSCGCYELGGHWIAKRYYYHHSSECEHADPFVNPKREEEWADRIF